MMEASFPMTSVDTTQYATVIQRHVVESTPLTNETLFAVFDPAVKKAMEMKWNINFKLKREEWGAYKK